MELEGKTALVTGGSQGIGKCFCEALSSQGVNVVCTDIIQRDVDCANFIVCDVREQTELEKCFQFCKQRFGHLDILVNNAGVLDDSEEGWKNQIDVNITALIQSSLLGLKYLTKGGAIVNTSSLSGVYRDSLYPIYSATKGAAPVYYGITNIRVMAICPGLTDTPILLDASNRTYLKVLKPMMEKRLTCFKQNPNDVSNCLIKILKSANSGSVWSVNEGLCKEIPILK